MSDEIFLEGKTYLSSKRAARETGYVQDYIGQLARKGLVDAQRVGGLWYVFPASLEAYKRNAEAFTPQPPKQTAPVQNAETIVSFDGKDYVSASKAAKLTGYHADYVGQLARAGKVLSRQVGNRWYVEREGLVAHKAEKDRLLAAVQSQASGLAKSAEVPSHRSLSPISQVHPSITPVRKLTGQDFQPTLQYIRDDGALFPALASSKEREPEEEEPVSVSSTPVARVSPLSAPGRRAVPIRVVPASIVHGHAMATERSITRKVGRKHGKTMFSAKKTIAALTVVLVLSYGFVSLKSSGTFAYKDTLDDLFTSHNVSGMAASTGSAFGAVGDVLERLIARELVYFRQD